MAGELAGKVAVVTGGAKGIGRATVELFVQEGAKVVIADLDVAGGEALAKELGPDTLFHRADISKPDDVQAMVDAAVEHFGGLHVLFNNAGLSSYPNMDFLDDPLEDFDAVMRVNVLGLMLGCQRAGRHMAKNGGGSIINNTSISGLVAGLALATYRASKVAAIHVSKSIAIDLAQYGIRVNALAPGHIPTTFNAFAPPGVSEQTKARLREAMQPVWDVNKPLKRIGTPHDVAQAVLFLASDRSAQITGIVMPVDGGISTGDPVNHLRELMDARSAALALGDD